MPDAHRLDSSIETVLRTWKSIAQVSRFTEFPVSSNPMSLQSPQGDFHVWTFARARTIQLSRRTALRLFFLLRLRDYALRPARQSALSFSPILLNNEPRSPRPHAGLLLYPISSFPCRFIGFRRWIRAINADDALPTFFFREGDFLRAKRRN